MAGKRIIEVASCVSENLPEADLDAKDRGHRTPMQREFAEDCETKVIIGYHPGAGQ
jgi:hypothetical protein